MHRCPGCDVPRDERFHKCPRCDRWWVIPDPDGPPLPVAPLGYHLPLLREVSRKCAAGFERSDEVVVPCIKPLDELGKLQTQAISRAQRHLVWRCITAIEKIHTFSVSQNVRDLNEGWSELAPAAAELLGVPIPPIAPRERDEKIHDRIELSDEE